MRRGRIPSATTAMLLLLLALTALALSISAHDPAPPLSGAVRKVQHETASTKSGSFDVAEATLSVSTTGCGLCQQTGLCDHAFKGSSGQFCLTLASGLPCCCPRDAQCVANAYSCRCRRSYAYTAPQGGGHPSKVVVTRTTSTTATSDETKSISLFSLFAMLLCVGCCVCACCKRDQRAHDDYPQPVYAASSLYGATDPSYNKYAHPSAPPADSYTAPYAVPAAPTTHSGGGYGNSFAAGALGAVAGLAGGMLVGSALGGGGNRSDSTATTTTTTTTYFDGDSGFGNATSSYDFAGDAGDFSGNDGGDFAGDS